MAEYILNVAGQTSKLDWAMPFQRTGAFPLDRSSVFSSYADAVKYAAGAGDDERGLGGTSYVGQTIAVYDNETVTLYIIEANRTLKKVGTTPVGDEKTIVVAKNGTVSLKGIAGLSFTGEDGQAVSYQPLLVNGELTWVVPSKTTVEGLSAEIEALKTAVGTLNTTVGNSTSGLVKDVADNKTAIAAINTKIGAIPDDKTIAEQITAEAAQAKAGAISAIMGEAGIDEKYDTLKEIADWILADETNSTALVNKVNEIYGDYLKKADKTELQGKITSLETLVGSLPEGATSTTVVGYIKEVVDGLKIGDYAKAADLTALTERVTTAEGKITANTGSITTNAGNIAKNTEAIEALQAVNAEKNFIASVDETNFTVGDDRKLALKDLPTSKITGLDNTINTISGKVEVLESKEITIADITNLQSTLDDQSAKITNLEGSVDKIKTDYVTIADFNTVVGNLENLKTDSINIMNILTWQEIPISN